MRDKIRRVGGQAFREFWPALIIALCWTVSRFSFLDPDYVVHAIANFSASFFFSSWITGHIVRISRQHKQDDAFGSVEETVKEAFEGVGQKVSALAETIKPMGDLAKKVLASSNLDPAVRALADASLAAEQKATEASSALSDVRKLLDPAAGWFLNQPPLVVRRRPHPPFVQGPTEPPWLRKDDGPTRATSSSVDQK